MPNPPPAKRPSRKPPRRRQVQIERTREDILLAAARALRRGGYKAVSMQEIADEVGFTAPALYGYFPSKEAIFAELVRTLQRELEATFSPPPAPGRSFRERISELYRRQLEWVDRRRDVFLAFFALQMRGEHVECEGGETSGPHDYMNRLSDWLRRAADSQADLGRSDPEEAAAVLMGIGQGFCIRWLLTDGATPLADDTERILDLFFHGILG